METAKVAPPLESVPPVPLPLPAELVPVPEELVAIIATEDTVPAMTALAPVTVISAC